MGAPLRACWRQLVHGFEAYLPTFAGNLSVAHSPAVYLLRGLREASGICPIEHMADAGCAHHPLAAACLLPCLLQSPGGERLDPEYKEALARTRQATAVHRAIGFLNTGSRARCADTSAGGASVACLLGCLLACHAPPCDFEPVSSRDQHCAAQKSGRGRVPPRAPLLSLLTQCPPSRLLLLLLRCPPPPRRAHVEIRRALHQNSVCRAPLLSMQHSKGDLAELYRLHLQQAEVPADFGTLLQLRCGRGAVIGGWGTHA